MTKRKDQNAVKSPPWTDEEDAALLAHPKLTAIELIEAGIVRPCRTVMGIRKHRQLLRRKDVLPAPKAEIDSVAPEFHRQHTGVFWSYAKAVGAIHDIQNLV